MNLYKQLYLGDLGNRMVYIYEIFLINVAVLMIVWLGFSLYKWRRSGNRNFIKWCGIIVGILFTLGLYILIFSKIFSGPQYFVASQTGIYIPRSVDILENNYTGDRDQELRYIVMKFNKTQMDDFIKSAEEKGWKFGTVIPYSLAKSLPQPNLMLGRKYPFPKVKRDGYYYLYTNTKSKGSTSFRTNYTTNKLFFLDTKSGILYFYYDSFELASDLRFELH
ncbi:hypothetical protein Thexy_1967 [Thermoanaerobacterium xylanolyticum LX-11]|uniref:Uncharacterized protein n=1 Tax=Thermoanaerobacterium xylanolyticum (strain ATCC 49914 / DSM 7097 / LX-11) TaxID=858215 RepID=F6BJP0_THEXL|nr:hypothetical protein [Thermoanaerobacterium xylanolyticum]AEF17986.1 hypothetical protein Thexy_1967 [Thermoanaerobacterium xylanolyticum LX-11]